MKTLLLATLLLLASFTSAISRTYEFKVLRVIDGDTVVIDAPYLPEELGQKLNLRIVGIDTPESGGRAKCDKERELASSAKQFVTSSLESATKVEVVLVKWDKFGGRVLGDLIIDGNHLSTSLIIRQLAVIYNGRGKKKDWCK
jgi:micrococcal nuclease